MPSCHGKQGGMHNMGIRKLGAKVQDVTCQYGTMNPRSMRYQFRLRPNMVDLA
jgi:hypothetical protein